MVLNPMGLGVNGAYVGNYSQPGAPSGFFQPGREMPYCPFHTDTLLVLVGSQDFQFRCPQDGVQYRQDMTPQYVGFLQAPPFVVPTNFAGDANRP